MTRNPREPAFSFPIPVIAGIVWAAALACSSAAGADADPPERRPGKPAGTPGVTLPQPTTEGAVGVKATGGAAAMSKAATRNAVSAAVAASSAARAASSAAGSASAAAWAAARAASSAQAASAAAKAAEK